ncbi:PKD domain-containing protein [Sunxiuqinia sp. A32]|uniref:PKD domain-containing protein n=1 Tax=Sunxiuqinia sp. A32 TaxID=3461496 RepID=UPI004045D8B4
MRRNILAVIGLLFACNFVLAQSGALQIRSTNLGPIDYCRDVVKLGNRVSVQGDDINSGLKVSIANFIKGEDQLSFESTATITGSWDAGTGTLTLRGKATASDYQTAIQNVEYTNISPSPTNGTRSIAITLNDVDYLPATEHFYQYISRGGIIWSTANSDAQNKTYYGLQGYLVTITSREENDFVWSKVKGVGWIGASDADVEGDWKWVTGPEAGTLFWRGDYTNGRRMNGEYSFWSSGEPNNSGDEDYAHINQNPSKETKSWNDLPDRGGGSGGYYYPQGYIVEFGGMEGDPDISLSAVMEINVWNIEFDSAIDRTICQNDTIQLNHEFEGNYEWFPKTALDDAYRSDPFAFPMDTIVYKVVSRNGTCADSAFFTVNVKTSPVVDLGDDQNICIGSSTTLDAGDHDYYLWNDGSGEQTLPVNETNIYSVKVGNEYTCFDEDEVKVTVHDYPKIDISNTDTLFCDQMSGTVKISVDKGGIEWIPFSSGLTFIDPNALQTNANVNAYGTYKSYFKITDAYGCASNDSINLSFYNTPSNDFSIDSMECYGYNLGVHYSGDGTSDANYTWYFQDTVYEAGVGLTDLEVSLGFDRSSNRDLGLIVNEGGCENPAKWEHIKVIPNMEIKVLDDDGCEPFLVDFTAETTELVNSYSWDFGDGGSASGKNLQHTYQQDGSYDVGLTIVSDEGCENYGLVEDLITVHPIPTVETSLDPDFCYPHVFQVEYTGTANPQDTYHWDLSKLDAEEILQDPANSPGPFEISLKNKPLSSIGLQITTEYSCETDPVEFNFKRQPWAEITSDLTEGCPPLTVNFSVTPNDNMDEFDYHWDFGQGDGLVPGENEMTDIFNAPDTQFNISSIVQSSITGCIDTIWADQSITVYPKPTASFQPDTSEVSIVNPEFTFLNSSEGAENYYWDFGDTLGTSLEAQPTYSYEEMGWYDVELIAENELFCTDTTYQTVLVAFDRIFPPNAINPNSMDEINREFLLAPVGVLESGYHMQVFNRWGERIFEAKDEFVGWDGKMRNGEFAPTGVYTWVIAYQDFLGRDHNQSGTVTLVY